MMHTLVKGGNTESCGMFQNKEVWGGKSVKGTETSGKRLFLRPQSRESLCTENI